MQVFSLVNLFPCPGPAFNHKQISEAASEKYKLHCQQRPAQPTLSPPPLPLCEPPAPPESQGVSQHPPSSETLKNKQSDTRISLMVNQIRMALCHTPDGSAVNSGLSIRLGMKMQMS